MAVAGQIDNNTQSLAKRQDDDKGGRLPGLFRPAIGFAALLLSLPAWAGGVVCEPPSYRPENSGPERELCAIQAAAKRFLDQQNIRDKTDWKPLGPDIRMMFDPCVAPLGATWAIYGGRKSVMVSCDRAVPSAYERKWKVAVDVYGESEQLNYHLHKAASAFVRRENARRKSNRKAGYPANETQVPKCVIPLAVEWRDRSRSSVDVICRTAVHTTWGKGFWRVRIPVE